MESWDKIKETVEQNGNVLTVTMEKLREAHGAGKLGVNVRTEISKGLAGTGLGHIPEDLPSYQEQHVRLYKHGTQIGDFIATVLAPGEANDAKLVERLSDQAPNYADIVQSIRDLVAE